jgi:hypothetical protein
LNDSRTVPATTCKHSAQNKITKEQDLTGNKSTSVERPSGTLLAKGTGSALNCPDAGYCADQAAGHTSSRPSVALARSDENRRWGQRESLIWMATEMSDAQKFSFN